MAKKEKQAPSLSDFNEENLLNQVEEPDTEVQEAEQEEIEVEEEKPKKKVESKAKPVKKEAAKEEETEEVEEDSEPVDGTTDEAETETEGQDDPKTFFAEVEKITGTAVDVEYGEVDPLSPQGVAMREMAVKEFALDSFLEEMKDNYPKVFQALQFASNGGEISELFTQTLSRDYSKVELKEGDEAVAKEILKEFYKSKGVKSEARITKMIETDEDSEGGLLSEAKSALEELKTEQEEARNQIVTRQAEEAATEKKRDSVMVGAIDEVLESRQLGDFKIVDRNEIPAFKKFVLENVRRAGNGKYEISTQLDPTNLKKQLQYAYFQFKGGNLASIVQEKATTQNVQKLKLRLSAEQNKTKKTTQKEDAPDNTSLQSFNIK